MTIGGHEALPKTHICSICIRSYTIIYLYIISFYIDGNCITIVFRAVNGFTPIDSVLYMGGPSLLNVAIKIRRRRKHKVTHKLGSPSQKPNALPIKPLFFWYNYHVFSLGLLLDR